MQWEELTSTDFAQAVKETDTCILPMGVIEKHSEHLPLGTDYLNIHKICCLAAEQSPAVVFPHFYIGQVYEARCFPGTVTIKPTLMLELLIAVCDEIGRNGFKKIILKNGHGGNTYLVPFIAQCTAWEEKSYCIYTIANPLYVTKDRQQQWNDLLDTPSCHACEAETSLTMANFEHLVKFDRIPETPAWPTGAMDNLPDAYAALQWYSNYPDHYAGDARTASRDKGLKLQKLLVDSFAEFIDAVKKDEVLPAVSNRFYQRTKPFTSPDQP